MQGDLAQSEFGRFIRNKYIIAVLAVDIITIVFILLNNFSNARKTAYITFKVTPTDSTIAIKGKDNYQNGTYRISPGDYTISVSHDNFDTKEIPLTISANDSINFALFLTKDSKVPAYYSYKANSDSYLLLNDIASENNNITFDSDHSAEQFIANFNSALKIQQFLPIESEEYEESPTGRRLTSSITIKSDDGEECLSQLCLKAIMLHTSEKTRVKTMINEKGLNADDYQIDYKIY